VRRVTRHKRAASPKCKVQSASRSIRSKKTERKSRPQSEGVWVRLHRKLVGAEWAVSEAYVGILVFCAIYFGSTWVMLGLMGIDTVAGTSICNLTSDWFLRVKLTALGAGLVWGLLILAPAALLAWCLRRSFDACPDRMLTKPCVRPMRSGRSDLDAAAQGLRRRSSECPLRIARRMEMPDEAR
jgi:hypothetical protein